MKYQEVIKRGICLVFLWLLVGCETQQTATECAIRTPVPFAIKDEIIESCDFEPLTMVFSFEMDEQIESAKMRWYHFEDGEWNQIEEHEFSCDSSCGHFAVEEIHDIVEERKDEIQVGVRTENGTTIRTFSLGTDFADIEEFSSSEFGGTNRVEFDTEIPLYMPYYPAQCGIEDSLLAFPSLPDLAEDQDVAA